MKSFTSTVQRSRHKQVVYFFATRAEVGGNHVPDSAPPPPLSRRESHGTALPVTGQSRPKQKTGITPLERKTEERGSQEKVNFVGPGDDDEREGDPRRS